MRKKIAAILTAITVSLQIFVMPASAEVIEWDGVSEMKRGSIYIITQELTIKKDFIIPHGAKLSVREGGCLVLRGNDLNVKVEGIFSVANDGLLELRRGALTIREQGTLDIYGQFFQYLDTEMKLSGKFTGYNASDIKVSGNITAYKTGSLFLRGKFVQTSGGTIGVTGSVEIDTRGEMRIEGGMTVTPNGRIVNLGYLSIGKSAAIINSGSIIMRRGSDYTRFGSLKNTKSGIFTDNRDSFEYEDMTVNILVDEPATEIRGIDVSYAQGDIDWKKVSKSDAEFVIIRAGRGTVDGKPMKEDDYFRQNIEGALENGLDVGVYFYSYAETVEQAIEEAEFFVSIIDGYTITYPVILDMEEEIEHLSVEDATQMVEAFFGVLMDNNYFPMLYSYKSWFETYLDMTVLDNYAIWLSQLDKVTYQGGYYIWQYSHTGKINGVDGELPLNISYIDFPEVLRKHKLNNL